ncbi:MAG: alginate export family protein [Pirellulales bacterium]
MTPFNAGNAPVSADLGHEIDLLVSYAITPRQEIIFGYSHFFAGRYYELTPGAPSDSDADFYYTHYQINF